MQTSDRQADEHSIMSAVTETPVPSVYFAALYQDHHPNVLTYFLRRFDRDTAIDCAAEVFTIAWRRLDDVPEGEHTIRWLYGVCRNVGRNQDRAQRRLRRLRARLGRQTPEHPVQPDAEAPRTSEQELVRLALSRLRYRDQEILRLSAWEELPRADIAEILGCSRHAVDQRIQRATERLRREYEPPLRKDPDHER